MKKEGMIEVTLKADYKSPPDWIPQKKLTAGTSVDVHWVSRKTRLGGHKGHIVQFVSKDKEPHWVNTTWDEVNHPQECILSQTPYAEGRPMVTIYCATHDDFVGIDPHRAEDINHCPLCGKEL